MALFVTLIAETATKGLDQFVGNIAHRGIMMMEHFAGKMLISMAKVVAVPFSPKVVATNALLATRMTAVLAARMRTSLLKVPMVVQQGSQCHVPPDWKTTLLSATNLAHWDLKGSVLCAGALAHKAGQTVVRVAQCLLWVV